MENYGNKTGIRKVWRVGFDFLIGSFIFYAPLTPGTHTRGTLEKLRIVYFFFTWELGLWYKMHT
jgi:hypothetical protein